MEFNPSKCVHLTNSSKYHPIKYSYYISNHLIQMVSSAKYIGVTFDEHLYWKNHIHNICAKANATHAFIRRNINNCPRHIKSNCYKTFVRPILEYVSPIWTPHLQADVSTIDKIQCTAACYIMTIHGEVVSPLCLTHLIGLLLKCIIPTSNYLCFIR